MTPERENRNNIPRQRRTRRHKPKKQRFGALQFILMLLVLGAAAGMITWAAIHAPEKEPTEETVSGGETGASGEDNAWSVEPTTVIHIAAAGDLNVTDSVVTNAMNASGYDFTETFMEVAPVFAQADLSLLNFEGILAGTPYGSQNGSAPAALAQELADMGIDVVQTANSASIRSGVLGLQSTIAGLQNVGITPVGTFADTDAFRKSGGYTIVEVEGIRVALVAFTKGMDNLGLPESSQNCVNVLYEDYTTDYKEIDTDAIQSVLKNVASAEPDITIALLHWGSEYNENISNSQEDIAELMMDHGVDAIIGTHSHLLQKIEFDEAAGTLIAWSLGDFFGDAQEAGCNYSVILDIEITMDNETGITTVTGYDTTPIYTLLPGQSGDGGHRVVQLEKAIARYESRYIGRVTEEVYDSMTYALGRIEQRIKGE